MAVRDQVQLRVSWVALEARLGFPLTLGWAESLSSADLLASQWETALLSTAVVGRTGNAKPGRMVGFRTVVATPLLGKALEGNMHFRSIAETPVLVPSGLVAMAC